MILAIDISGSMEAKDFRTPDEERRQRLAAVRDIATEFVTKRAGAPMTNLSHSASFHSNDRIAPSNLEIRYLGSGYETPELGVPEERRADIFKKFHRVDTHGDATEG